MKPIALLVNDLHIDKNNILDFCDNWDEILDVCHDNEIEQIYLGGDVFTSTASQTLAPCLAVHDSFSKAGEKGVSICIAPGNHDKPARDGLSSWVDLYTHLSNVEVVRRYKIIDYGTFKFAIFAYFTETGKDIRDNIIACKKELADKYKCQASDCIAYIHEGVHGALGNLEIPLEIPQSLVSDFKIVLAGHYHNRTHIKGTDIYYIGSSRANSFGEDEEKGYTILYSDGSNKFVKNEVNYRYVTDVICADDVSDWKNTYGEKYKVRLQIHCSSAEAEVINRQELIDRGASKVEFITEKIQAIEAQNSDIEDKFNNLDLQYEYSNWCDEKEIDSKMGIEYIKKISNVAHN